jgi:hypothetical protein
VSTARSLRSAVALAIAASVGATGARAEPAARKTAPASQAAKSAASEEGEVRPRPLPIAASLVPGLLVHGAGHFVAGERAVARRLFVMEGIGLGMAGAGGSYLVATGASRHYAGPPIALIVSGLGLFGISWLADVVGTAGGGHAAEASAGPPIEIEAGYGYVDDPRFDYGQFAVAGATVRLGATRLSPGAWLALDDDNQRLRLDAAYRLIGARSARPTGDASALEVTGALTHHRYPGDGFDVSTAEAAVSGRLDLGRLGRSLSGSFADMAVGLGAEVVNYHPSGAGADLGEILLARFGYGMLIGRPGRVHGEASIYYDHRRDTFTGGLSPGNGPGSGFAGFFGADLLLYIGARWGVRARFEQGAARVAHLGLVARFGDEP